MTLEKADVATLKAIRANKDSGKLRFINVWATWCGPCIAEFDELVEHNLRFRIRQFEMVTISADSPDDEAVGEGLPQQETRVDEELHHPGGEEGRVLRRLDPATVWKGELPYTIIVNEKGEVVYREYGALSFLKMRRAIVPELNRIKPWGGLSPIKPTTAQNQPRD